MVGLGLVVVFDIVVMEPSPSPVEVVWLGGGVVGRKVFFLFFFDVDERGGERDAASASGKATLPTSSSQLVSLPLPVVLPPVQSDAAAAAASH